MEGILQPVIFVLMGPSRNLASMHRRGVPPSMRGMIPVPGVTLTISGITKDETGAAAGGFTVYLFDVSDPLAPVLSQTTISDGAGLYSFSVGRGGYWAVDYKVGTPDKAGASVMPLAGV